MFLKLRVQITLKELAAKVCLMTPKKNKQNWTTPGLIYRSTKSYSLASTHSHKHTLKV